MTAGTDSATASGRRSTFPWLLTIGLGFAAIAAYVPVMIVVFLALIPFSSLGTAAPDWPNLLQIAVPRVLATLGAVVLVVMILRLVSTLRRRGDRFVGDTVDPRISKFGTASQRLTLLLSIGTAVEFASALAFHGTEVWFDAVWLTVAIAFLPAALPWAMGNTVLRGEIHAIRTRTGRWRLIAINRIATSALLLVFIGTLPFSLVLYGPSQVHAADLYMAKLHYRDLGTVTAQERNDPGIDAAPYVLTTLDGPDIHARLVSAVRGHGGTCYPGVDWSSANIWRSIPTTTFCVVGDLAIRIKPSISTAGQGTSLFIEEPYEALPTHGPSEQELHQP